MRRRDLVEGEIYVDCYQQFMRLDKKGLLFHKFSCESNGREWTEHRVASDILMTAGEYYNRMYGTYDGDQED